MDCEAQSLPTPTVAVPSATTMQAAPVRQQKDPKKQEAGRRGAEARRKKMEALKAELTAAKETVSETVPKEHAEQHVKPVVEQRVWERSEGTSGWIMGISLAVIIGAVMYSRLSAPLERRQPHGPQECSTVVTAQSAAVQPSRALFDM